MTQTNLFFGHFCPKFSLRVLLSFCLIFYQFQSGVAYKSVAYKKKRVYEISTFEFVKIQSFMLKKKKNSEPKLPCLGIFGLEISTFEFAKMEIPLRSIPSSLDEMSETKN